MCVGFFFFVCFVLFSLFLGGGGGEGEGCCEYFGMSKRETVE